MRLVKHLLAEACVAPWSLVAFRHKAPIAYEELQSTPSDQLSKMVALGASWDVMLGVRSFCRMRCGLLQLGHKDRKLSQASFTAVRSLWH